MSEQDEVYWRYLPRTRRPGFTVVEYLSMLFGLIVLVRIALPFALERLGERNALVVLEAVAQVEAAARTAATNGDLAALEDTPAGQIPPGLAAYLPPGFTFDHDRWSLDWDLYEVRDRAREVLVGDVHGAIEMRILDDRVRASVIRIAGPRVWLVEEDRVSVLVPDLTDAGGAS